MKNHIRPAVILTTFMVFFMMTGCSSDEHAVTPEEPIETYATYQQISQEAAMELMDKEDDYQRA